MGSPPHITASLVSHSLRSRPPAQPIQRTTTDVEPSPHEETFDRQQRHRSDRQYTAGEEIMLQKQARSSVMSSMRLMTANLLHHNGATAHALRETLDIVKPDILAVQELTVPLLSTIADRFPHHLLAPRPDGPGIGMAADRPVTVDEVPMPYRSGMVATLQPEDWPEFEGRVEVFNVHLANPIGRWPRSMTGVRRGQVEAIESRTESMPDRRVLCGDLNATPMWPAYRRLRRPYQDGIGEVEANQGRRPARTWAPLRKGPRLLRIDHVLVSGLRVVSTQTVPLAGSDHLAVVADLVDDR